MFAITRCHFNKGWPIPSLFVVKTINVIIHIWPVLGLEIYSRERIELSMSIDSDDSDDCD